MNIVRKQADLCASLLFISVIYTTNFIYLISARVQFYIMTFFFKKQKQNIYVIYVRFTLSCKVKRKTQNQFFFFRACEIELFNN